MINLKEKLKNFIKTIDYRRLALGIIALFIISLAIWGIRGTHAYYNSATSAIQIFNTKIGNFAGEGESVKEGPLTDRNTDVNIIFYTQMPDNPNKYKENKYVPAAGYEVNETASNCYPTEDSGASYSDYTIKEDGTVTLKVSENKPTQITCRIYYDRDKLSDIVVYAMIQDDKGDKEYNGKKYKLVNKILETYKYDGYTCSKNISTSINYDTNTKKFTFVTSGPNTCYAYFSK